VSPAHKPTDELQTHLCGPVEGLVEFYGQGATSGASLLHALDQIFLPCLDNFGVLDAFFAFEFGLEEAQELVDEAHGNGLDALAFLAGGPGLARSKALLSIDAVCQRVP